MSRGQPDYSGSQVKAVGVTLSDMADLAVRLGSIVEFDRRGDIVALDDFEGSVIKWLNGVEAAYTVTLDSTSVKSGSQALKLHNEAVAGVGAGIQKSFKKLGSSRLGMEISFSNPPDTSYLLLELDDYDSVKLRSIYVKFDFGEKIIQVYDHTLGFVTVEDNFRVFEENFCFTPVKLVADFETGIYERLMVGNIEYDISAYTLPWTLSTATPRELAIIDLGNDASATEADIYLDDFILTQNEP